jgi:hypothetical protein
MSLSRPSEEELMNMHRTLSLVLAAMMLTIGLVRAHEDFRVIGTLITQQESSIEVKSRDGKTTSIKLDKQTVITRDNQAVDAAALAVGQSVVVDAYGDTADGSLALEIRIVPPIAGGT